MITDMKFRALLLAACGGLLAPVTPLAAQTVGFAEAIDHVSSACQQDIAKYCAKVNLGGGRMTQCLIQNPSTSPSCKKAMADVLSLLKTRAAARTSLPKVCDADRQRLCAGMVAGDGHLLECFAKVKPNVSAACRQVVANAGYDVKLDTGPITDQVHLSSDDLLNSLQGVDDANISAAKLRQLTLQSMHDPRHADRMNRPPVYEHLSNQAQLTVAIQFDFNSARINPNSYRALGLMADALYHPYLEGYCFLIIGHTDAVGSRDYNLKLSQQRADAIRDALVNPFGISPARVETVGMGEEQLLEPGSPNAAGNRRVQLINIGKLSGNAHCPH